jgi:hypothetical protein
VSLAAVGPPGSAHAAFEIAMICGFFPGSSIVARPSILGAVTLCVDGSQ